MNEIFELNPLFYVAALAVVVLGNVAFTIISFKRLRLEKQKSAELFKRLNEVTWDMKGLYDSSKGMGKRLQGLERRSEQLAETQEQFTLKEPTHQTYQNAIRMIQSGDSVDKISESSGLSRGEIELLSLLRKIEDGESVRTDA
jgi:hypothetical protein